jgi:hypothetical protein
MAAARAGEDGCAVLEAAAELLALRDYALPASFAVAWPLALVADD